MAKYLDPRNDFVFKKVFGEHKDLLKSFLNSLMPFEEGREIVDLEYIMAEMVPENPLKKNSIVDVCCIDNYGRQFIVEMQMYWTTAFLSRMVFNAAKAYVRQLGSSEHFKSLQPVYGLGILNETMKSGTDEFYHHYQIKNEKDDKDTIRDLEFVVVELSKQFNPEKLSKLSLMHRKMAVLWLRFLKETGKSDPSPELSENSEIKQALDICKQAAFTDAELMTYDKYWDIIRVENTLLIEREERGREEGIAEGKEIGKEEAKEEIAKSMHKNGMPLSQIATITGFSEERLKEILKQ